MWTKNQIGMADFGTPVTVVYLERNRTDAEGTGNSGLNFISGPPKTTGNVQRKLLTAI
jgi:hypothetical protein